MGWRAQVVAASFVRLVELLTWHGDGDVAAYMEYLDAFLLCLPAFSSPAELMHALCERFAVPAVPPPALLCRVQEEVEVGGEEVWEADEQWKQQQQQQQRQETRAAPDAVTPSPVQRALYDQVHGLRQRARALRCRSPRRLIAPRACVRARSCCGCLCREPF